MTKCVKDSEKFGRERIALFRRLFVGREDAYVMGTGNQIVAYRKPLDDDVLKAHLRGEYRVGTYPVIPNGRTRHLVFDIDIPNVKIAKKILKRLRKRKVAAYIEKSKAKGFHIWTFFNRPLRASRAREFARRVLRGLENPKIEVFPKQDKVTGDGLGNSIFLPLFGADTPAGRTLFLDEHFAAIKDQWSLLRSIRRTSRKLIIKAVREAESAFNQPTQSTKSTGGPIPRGERNNTLTSLAGAMRHQGATESTILAALLDENQSRCKPPLPAKELKNIAASVGKYAPAEQRKGRKLTDLFIRDLSENGVIFFHTPDNEAYVKVKNGDHNEVWRMRDTMFKRYMSARFYKKFKAMPRTQVLSDILTGLEGIALFEGHQEEVFTRIAEYNGALYLDLCNEIWQVVEITANRWQVLSESPVMFRRARGMTALAVPKRGGSIADLRPFLNLESEDDFVIVISWLIAALRSKGPYPPLVLYGEAGSAKSTAVRVLRALVDPNTAPLRSEPRDTRDLMIAARNSWCIAFDNVSHLTWRLSDDLCRLATGGGFSTRQLYTDTDETLFDAMRPVILNGIDAVVTRGDLLDRSLITYLPVIPDNHRKSEQQFWRSFRKAQPALLGSLLDAVSCALRNLKSVKLPTLPRMADFAQWVVAAEPALGWAQGCFLRVYESNRGIANALSLEASLLVAPLKRFLSARLPWSGTAAELLKGLNTKADDQTVREDSWPKNPQILSTQLRRIAPNLRESGIDVHFGKKTPGKNAKRIIAIRNVTEGKTEGNGDA